MPEIDPDIFSIRRPRLDRYKAFVQRDLAVETYKSAAGQMMSRGSLHRISLNRTGHRNYAYRLGGGAFRAVERPPFTLGFQPATVPLEVEGDAADYISIFQAPNLYRSVGGAGFQPEERDGDGLSAGADPTTLHVALSLALAVETAGGADPLLMEHLSFALARCVVKLFSARAPETAAGPLAPQHLRRVVDYIDAVLERADLSVEDLAAVAHLSPYHFSRAFKQATGLAPHRFVLERRIARARLHLADGRESLAGIAYATGFSSQAHFSSMFRRFVGMTPGEYRQAVRV